MDKKTECKVCQYDGGAYDKEEDVGINKTLFFVIPAAVLFIIGLIFRRKLHNFPFSYPEYVIFLGSYLLVGWKVLWNALRNISRGEIFDEYFLMSIATIGAISIHELPEAVGVMLFFTIGEFFQDLSVNRSRKSIKALLNIRPLYANLKIGKEVKEVSPEEVRIGDIIIVKPGERVPLDGEIIKGSSTVDTSALTGESMPKSVNPGDTILSGMINQGTLLNVKVTKKIGDSYVSKILHLVENASAKKSPTEKFITKFARYYTPVILLGAVVVAVIPPLLIPGATFSQWVYRALVLLVISCPCALVISIPLGYFGGIGSASRKGILIKGANILDALTNMKTVIFDKTGTLTKGVFKVTKIVSHNGFLREEVLQMAAVVESQSNHPIARSILEAYGKSVDTSVIEYYQEMPAYGIKARVKDKTIIAGNDRILHRENVPHNACITDRTVVHIAVNGIYAGYIIIEDEIKEDARIAVESLKKSGVKQVLMLTGDSKFVAESVSKKLGIDTYFAELLPDEKVAILERMEEEKLNKEKIAFVGDGINDAPVIARSDVGVAMGGLGSDAAVETADVVIMTDMPSKVATSIDVAKKTRIIVWQNIILALGIKLVFISLGIIGLATMWEAVFADVGVALIAIFNAGRIIYKRY